MIATHSVAQWKDSLHEQSFFWERLAIPEIVLPGQVQRTVSLSGERGLLFAMIRQAVFDLLYSSRDNIKNNQKRPHHAKRGQPATIAEAAKVLREETLEWINADLPDIPFSFAHICNALDWDIKTKRAIVLEALESWDRTNGEVPYIPDRRNASRSKVGLKHERRILNRDKVHLTRISPFGEKQVGATVQQIMSGITAEEIIYGSEEEKDYENSEA